MASLVNFASPSKASENRHWHALARGLRRSSCSQRAFPKRFLKGGSTAPLVSRRSALSRFRSSPCSAPAFSPSLGSVDKFATTQPSPRALHGAGLRFVGFQPKLPVDHWPRRSSNSTSMPNVRLQEKPSPVSSTGRRRNQLSTICRASMTTTWT